MQCAVLSPKFQVQKDWKVRDINPNAITIRYSQKNPDGSAGDVDVSEIFSVNNVVPSSKMMTFKNAEEIEITSDYSEGSKLPEGLGNRIGHFKVDKSSASQGGNVTSAIVKVKVKLDDNSLFLVESATLEEEVEVEEEKKKEEKKEEKKDEEKKDGEDAEMKDADKEPAEKVLVKKSRRTALKVVSDINAPLTEKDILEALEQEGKMTAHDQLVIDTAEARNALESYVYDIRPKVRGELSEYYKEEEAQKFVSELDAMEEWLYEDEGENASKSTYVAKYTELKKKGDFAVNLQFEANHRAECIKVTLKVLCVCAVFVVGVAIFYYLFPLTDLIQSCQFILYTPLALCPIINFFFLFFSFLLFFFSQQSVEGNIAHFTNWAKSTDEKFAHISEEDRAKVLKKCEEVQTWLTTQLAAQDAKKKFEIPALKINDMRTKQDDLYKYAFYYYHYYYLQLLFFFSYPFLSPLRYANPIMSKPKPLPPKEEKKEEKKDEKKEESPKEEKKEEEKKEEEKKDEKKDEEKKDENKEVPEPMEVDLD